MSETKGPAAVQQRQAVVLEVGFQVVAIRTVHVQQQRRPGGGHDRHDNSTAWQEVNPPPRQQRAVRCGHTCRSASHLASEPV